MSENDTNVVPSTEPRRKGRSAKASGFIASTTPGSSTPQQGSQSLSAPPASGPPIAPQAPLAPAPIESTGVRDEHADEARAIQVRVAAQNIKELKNDVNDSAIFQSLMADLTNFENFNNIVFRQVRESISPAERLLKIMESKQKIDSLKFFCAVHLKRGHSWYAYVKNQKSAATYIIHANNLDIGLNAMDKSGKISPLSIATCAGMIMQNLRQKLSAYATFFPDYFDDPRWKRFEYAGSLSVWCIKGETVESYKQNFSMYLINYMEFIQSYVASVNTALNRVPATDAQQRNFYEKTATGMHFAANCFSVANRVSWCNGQLVKPSSGPFQYFRSMLATEVSQFVELCMAEDWDGAMSIVDGCTYNEA